MDDRLTSIYLTTQPFSENIHAEVYSLLIDTYIRETAERTRLFNAIQTSEWIWWSLED